MDIRIWSIIISAGVAIFIAVLNHFIVTPIKEKRQRKRNQLLSLYAPAYALICTRIKIVKNFSLNNKKLILGNDGNKDYQTQVYMEQFIHERSGFANDDLIDAWVKYSSQFGEFKKEYTEQLVIAIVKGYNHLKKDLNIDYDKDELETGIPDCIKEYRDLLKKG